MPKRIHKLPVTLVNQIAAGEVIERPASVVKELLENSLDANATQIRVTLSRESGQLIRVSDDGCGIHKDDLPLAMGSHATSKIRELSDLEAIASLGFRGEALASICSVAHCSIASKVEGQDSAWQIKTSGTMGEVELEPIAHPVGTTVTVHDLFFNTPVRKKFLRADKTELNYIEQLIKQIMLSRFDVSFQIFHDDQRMLHVLAVTKQSEWSIRLSQLFGERFIQQSQFIDESATQMRLFGWLGTAELSRSQADIQYCYINGRMVRDKLINHAIRQAYAETLPAGKYAAYVLYLEMDQSQVDVNVHPTKREVRFYEARMVHDFIVSRIARIVQQYATSAQEFIFDDISNDTLQVAEHVSVYQPLFKRKTSATSVQQPLGTVITQLHSRYILARRDQDILLCDQCVAICHITYQRLLAEYETGGVKMRPLLVPITVSLAELDANCCEQYSEVLQRLGLVLHPLTSESIIIRQIPVLLSDVAVQQMVLLTLQKLASQEIVDEQNIHCILALLAKQQASAKPLTIDDMDQCLSDIEQLGSPMKSFTGEMIYTWLTTDCLQQLMLD